MSTPNAVCLGMGQQAQALKCFVRVVFWVAAPLPVCLAMYFPEKKRLLNVRPRAVLKRHDVCASAVNNGHHRTQLTVWNMACPDG